MLQILLVIYSGVIHAFEADHLLAVNTIVSTQKKTITAISIGAFWGIGHTFMIFLLGLVTLLFRVKMGDNIGYIFNSIVGFALIALALYRLYSFHSKQSSTPNRQSETGQSVKKNQALSFSVGLVHGLAGSGSVIMLIMSQTDNIADGMFQILLFGVGLLIGMIIAVSMLSFSFTKKKMQHHKTQLTLTYLSTALCVGYGGYLIYQNLI